MNTPIYDFVCRYIGENNQRFHMPGHKGKPVLGCEPFDITEINGADSLYEANGIIARSEANAGELFGADTFYSTEGSSLCIRAMLCLMTMYAKASGKKPLILAGRNAHKTLINTAALLDFSIEWLCPQRQDSYLSCSVSAKEVESALLACSQMPIAVYITSPDYLGFISDIKGIAEVCHRYNVYLMVDNAHGAYLRFLSSPLHPIDLGADICCDSAHKTLPVLTGGAYLHISKDAPAFFAEHTREAMALFGSTSPSYLILQSLDLVNRYLADSFRKELQKTLIKIETLRQELCAAGYVLLGDEPMKLTVAAKQYGYSGSELSEILEEKGIFCEFSDRDYLVLMPSVQNGDAEIERLGSALLGIKRRESITDLPPFPEKPQRVLGIRQALFSERETVSVEKSLGRVFASAVVGCPPAVPIIACGERITKSVIECFEYYGISECCVVCE